MMDLDDSIDRRRFMEIMGASMALAGLTACSRMPLEKIVPYVIQPEEIIPGKPLFFATATTLRGYATGILVESHMGRPTKIEGNPDHPASLGATDSITQAQILSLYDPERSQTVVHEKNLDTWDGFIAALNKKRSDWQKNFGNGLYILSETVTSPTMGNQLHQLLKSFPQAHWHSFEPITRDNARKASLLAFGEDLEFIYEFKKADIILSLDSDFLSHVPGSTRYSHDFSDRRRVRSENLKTDQFKMNRLYVIESTPSITGSMADHRLNRKASSIEIYVLALAKILGINIDTPSLPPKDLNWLSVVAKDLQSHPNSSIITIGLDQTPRAQAIVHAINLKLGNIGKTIIPIPPVEFRPVDQLASVCQLVTDMNAGKVDTLIVLGGNPVYYTPIDLNFSKSFLKVPLRIHLGLYQDETATLSHWHLPETHSLETWSDARAFDGTVTIMQPLIAPLYQSKSAHWVLASLMENLTSSDYQIVRDHWEQLWKVDFDPKWEKALQQGIVENTSFSPKQVKLNSEILKSTYHPLENNQVENNQAENDQGLEIIFRSDSTIWDGRFANNSWLQELFKPLTQLSWDNAAFLSPRTAQRLHLSTGDIVLLRYSGRNIHAPVWILAGHADESVTLQFGFGRTQAGKVGSNIGYNAYLLQTSDHPYFNPGLEITKTEKTHIFTKEQDQDSMKDRDIIHNATIQDFQKNQNLFHEKPLKPHSLYPQFPYTGYAWAMVIDTNTCTGCSACVIACQAENNIPSVGKDQIIKKRNMYWIRVDRYYVGKNDNPKTFFQPIPCMHCEDAPCEVVCPTAATVHGSEGLNEMVYNRCVGTRYCSNNCPYKVRRFNFFQYSDYKTPSFKAMRNPDVTVRSRGVMEKCTYCIQRIVEKRIPAENENRRIRDGEIKTACQQVCPTESIIFGDLNTQKSVLNQLKSQPHNYGLLAELGTRPRTTYLAKFTNPNRELEII